MPTATVKSPRPAMRGAQGGTAPVPEPAMVRPAIEAAGVALRPDIGEQILAALRRDRMAGPEIRRQLAKAGVEVGEAQLMLCLRAMVLDGRLTERVILERPCWATVSR